MRIYSMTATFGKLNHEVLTLEPGLNVIDAPNEWGKSTWCAFLINMLYGIDTKQRAGGSVLADKVRYAPWSGAPMSGRIELNWNGRDITIERSSTARVPFGNFRAFETHTGVDVPELDGTNCGKVLLGVERSVFTRSAFVKHTDMPVSADDALRRRLNALVTTGDESGDGDRLGSTLKDLKNKCRYNNSGLLPQAEAERDQLRTQLYEIQALAEQSAQLQQRQTQLSSRIDQLVNHEATLRFNSAKEDALRVQQAQEALEASRLQVTKLQEALVHLPDPAQAKPALDAGNQLSRELEQLQTEKRMLPPEPADIAVPEYYSGMTPQQTVELAQGHFERYTKLEQKRKKALTGFIIFCVLLSLSAIGAAFGALLKMNIVMIACGGAAALSLLLLILNLISAGRLRTAQTELRAAHPGVAPEYWVKDAQSFVTRQAQLAQAKAEYTRRAEDLNRRETLLMKQIHLFVGEGSLQQRLTQWNEALVCKKELDEAQARLQMNENHFNSLTAMVRTVEPPACPDPLTMPIDETLAELNAARTELQDIQSRLHQNHGHAEALGQEAVLRSRLDTLLRRINRLEDTYRALELAQEALYQASATLQRRFAPRITKETQELFSRLTDGRYERLSLAEDFSLDVGAQGEDTLYGTQWRSDGTADQLYLALRLAVAGELIPDVPLVLDDALLRFDDIRLGNAMNLLKELSADRQVIVFSCHDREKKYI